MFYLNGKSIVTLGKVKPFGSVSLIAIHKNIFLGLCLEEPIIISEQQKACNFLFMFSFSAKERGKNFIILLQDMEI